ncbi:MAG: polysaccharide pyruvyl transferase family protein, partial [Candidatus Paceibacteria bacterium]
DHLYQISNHINPDIVVLPGCTLYPEVLKKYEPIFERFKEKGIPILFLGAGSVSYTDKTANNVKNILDGFGKSGIITRNEKAFNQYSQFFTSSYNGIDCAFFIDNWFSPSKTSQESIALTFDKISEPNVSSDSVVVRPNHTPFGDLYSDINGGKYQIRSFNSNSKEIQDGIFVSDSLKDYLRIYASASITHTDRIHACIPALVYGNKSKFYYSTPRQGILSRLGLNPDSTMTLERERLFEERKQQINETKNIINTLIN